MNRPTLIHYQATLWPAVCKAQNWPPNDSCRRRKIRADCWQNIGITNKADSMPANDAETTALFTLLRLLAEPDNISRAIEWDKCRADYLTYNTCRQADWWEAVAYGPNGSPRLRHARFSGRTSASGDPLEPPLSTHEAKQRLLTMRTRAKQRKRARSATPEPSASHAH